MTAVTNAVQCIFAPSTPAFDQHKLRRVVRTSLIKKIAYNITLAHRTLVDTGRVQLKSQPESAVTQIPVSTLSGVGSAPRGYHKCCATVPKSRSAPAVQDGAVCLFDMRSRQLAHRLPVAAEDVAVPSVTFSPLDSHTLHCCADAAVLTLDLRRACLYPTPQTSFIHPRC